MTMFKPWKGNKYSTTRLLILGESAFAYKDEDGALRTPSARHSIQSVECAIENLAGTSGFMRTISKALANEATPSRKRLSDAWARVAFTNFVPVALASVHERPSPRHWRLAREKFPQLLKILEPRRVIVLGRNAWDQMDEFSSDLEISKDLGGYRLSTGKVCYCFATRHPRAGFVGKR